MDMLPVIKSKQAELQGLVFQVNSITQQQAMLAQRKESLMRQILTLQGYIDGLKFVEGKHEQVPGSDGAKNCAGVGGLPTA